MDNVQPVFLGCVEERSLTVDILVIEAQACFEEQVEALLLAFPADIEEDCLLIVIFEVRVGSMLDEKSHQIEGLFMVYEYG